MWLLRNNTPYAAERNWTRDKDGIHWYLVVVRGTFTVQSQGRLVLDDEQPSPILAPEYMEAPGESSLRYDSDLLERKPGTDVVVLGHAYAPRGRPATSVPVLLQMGTREKKLVVYGTRAYYEGVVGLATTTPEPFVKQPITYELAFGGGDMADADPSKNKLDERNPVGRGFPQKGSRWRDQAAHCIEYAEGAVATRGPAGFGPIDRGWLPRRQLAGTYDAQWIESKRPLLPDDYDQRFGMCAPEDQQFPTPLVGGEPIGLLNMTPDGTLAFVVPKVDITMSTAIANTRHEHRPHMSSVTIEPDLRRVSICWQTSLRVAAPEVDFVSTTDITASGGAP